MRLGKRRTIFKTPSSILRKDTSRSRITPARPACLTRSPSCFPGKLYGDTEYVEERHRHRFEVGVALLPTRAIGSALHVPSAQVNPELKSHFEDLGFRFVGQDVEGERMEVTELDGTDRHVNPPPLPQVTTTCLLTCDPPAPQSTPTSWACSITLSSPPGPSSRRLLTLACCWLQPGSCRATCRRAAACRHGNRASTLLLGASWSGSFRGLFFPPRRDTYSDRSGSSSPDSEISELKLPSISSE